MEAIIHGIIPNSSHAHNFVFFSTVPMCVMALNSVVLNINIEEQVIYVIIFTYIFGPFQGDRKSHISHF